MRYRVKSWVSSVYEVIVEAENGDAAREFATSLPPEDSHWKFVPEESQHGVIKVEELKD